MKAVLIIIGIILALAVGFWMFYELVGWITLFAWMFTAAAIFGGLLYVIYLLARGKGFAVKPAKKEYRVVDSRRKGVYLFRSEPALKDVIMIDNELHLAELELQGEVFQVDNGSEVIVLEDAGREAVLVRVKARDKKSKEDVSGWVSRGNLVSDKLIR